MIEHGEVHPEALFIHLGERLVFQRTTSLLFGAYML
jgi:hypothetical protein